VRLQIGRPGAAVWTAAALLLCHGAVATGDDGAVAPATEASLLATGEAALAAGDVNAALGAFESAAAARHSGAAEVAAVRAYLQAGEYRRAMAFAAHTAGAHVEYPHSAAIYAWLLQAGGQREAAERALTAARAAAPGDALLERVREQLAQPWPQPDAGLLSPPLRFAPYSVPALGPGTVIGSATLIDGGRRALAPLDILAAAADGRSRDLWLRNGLGEATRATIEREVTAAGVTLAVLRLETPLRSPEVVVSPRTPFAGSPAYVVDYATSATASDAAWPWLRLGFLGRIGSEPGVQALGIDMPPGPRGGPVFDDAGRIAGVAARALEGQDRLLTAQTLAMVLDGAPWESQSAGPAVRMTPEEIYERALLLALQLVIVDRSE
jgi:tetratricopeptide (TPR) repeat protein